VKRLVVEIEQLKLAHEQELAAETAKAKEHVTLLELAKQRTELTVDRPDATLHRTAQWARSVDSCSIKTADMVALQQEQ
jgi:hypothetical protein